MHYIATKQGADPSDIKTLTGGCPRNLKALSNPANSAIKTWVSGAGLNRCSLDIIMKLNAKAFYISSFRCRISRMIARHEQSWATWSFVAYLTNDPL